MALLEGGTLQGLIPAEDQSMKVYPVSREIICFTKVIFLFTLYKMAYIRTQNSFKSRVTFLKLELTFFNIFSL